MFRNFLKNIQNFFLFNPVVPNLADSCIFEHDEISSEWLFETPSPYPNNFKCSRTVRCPLNKFIHYRFNRLRIDTTDGLLEKDLGKCKDFLKISDDNEVEEYFCGQIYPEQSVFHRNIDHFEKQALNSTTSKWLIANTSVLNVEFQSDDVLNNFGTSLTFKCSDSNQLNDIGNSKNLCMIYLNIVMRTNSILYTLCHM